MSHVDDGPLANYNSLLDPNLSGYFKNTRIRRHLRKSGIVTKRGSVVTETQYRINMARKEHRKQVREMLATAIVSKTLDIERQRQAAIKRKLEEIAKVELVKRVKAERERQRDLAILPYLSPREAQAAAAAVAEVSPAVAGMPRPPRARRGSEPMPLPPPPLPPNAELRRDSEVSGPPRTARVLEDGERTPQETATPRPSSATGVRGEAASAARRGAPDSGDADADGVVSRRDRQLTAPHGGDRQQHGQQIAVGPPVDEDGYPVLRGDGTAAKDGEWWPRPPASARALRSGRSSRSEELSPRPAVPPPRVDSSLSSETQRDGRTISPRRRGRRGDADGGDDPLLSVSAEPIDTRHLWALDRRALEKYNELFERAPHGHRRSPYLENLALQAEREVAAAAVAAAASPATATVPHPPVGPRRAAVLQKRRIVLPRDEGNSKAKGAAAQRSGTAGVLMLHRLGPAFKEQELVQSFCELTFRFFGGRLRLETKNAAVDPRHEVVVEQQHCGGSTLVVFRALLLPKKDFVIISRRHRGYPFSLTFFVDGVLDARLSACCEYKHQSGYRLGGKSGHFGVLAVRGSAPCYKCQVERGLNISSAPPPPKWKFGSKTANNSPRPGTTVIQQDEKGGAANEQAAAEASVTTYRDDFDTEGSGPDENDYGRAPDDGHAPSAPVTATAPSTDQKEEANLTLYSKDGIDSSLAPEEETSPIERNMVADTAVSGAYEDDFERADANDSDARPESPEVGINRGGAPSGKQVQYPTLADAEKEGGEEKRRTVQVLRTGSRDSLSSSSDESTSSSYSSSPTSSSQQSPVSSSDQIFPSTKLAELATERLAISKSPSASQEVSGRTEVIDVIKPEGETRQSFATTLNRDDTKHSAVGMAGFGVEDVTEIFVTQQHPQHDTEPRDREEANTGDRSDATGTGASSTADSHDTSDREERKSGSEFQAAADQSQSSEARGAENESHDAIEKERLTPGGDSQVVHDQAGSSKVRGPENKNDEAGDREEPASGSDRQVAPDQGSSSEVISGKSEAVGDGCGAEEGLAVKSLNDKETEVVVDRAPEGVETTTVNAVAAKVDSLVTVQEGEADKGSSYEAATTVDAPAATEQDAKGLAGSREPPRGSVRTIEAVTEHELHIQRVQHEDAGTASDAGSEASSWLSQERHESDADARYIGRSTVVHSPTADADRLVDSGIGLATAATSTVLETPGLGFDAAKERTENPELSSASISPAVEYFSFSAAGERSRPATAASSTDPLFGTVNKEENSDDFSNSWVKDTAVKSRIVISAGDRRRVLSDATDELTELHPATGIDGAAEAPDSYKAAKSRGEFAREENTASMSLAREENTASMSLAREENTASMSLAREENTASMSLAREENTASMSLAREENTASMSLAETKSAVEAQPTVPVIALDQETASTTGGGGGLTLAEPSADTISVSSTSSLTVPMPSSIDVKASFPTGSYSLQPSSPTADAVEQPMEDSGNGEEGVRALSGPGTDVPTSQPFEDHEDVHGVIGERSFPQQSQTPGVANAVRTDGLDEVVSRLDAPAPTATKSVAAENNEQDSDVHQNAHANESYHTARPTPDQAGLLNDDTSPELNSSLASQPGVTTGIPSEVLHPEKEVGRLDSGNSPLIKASSSREPALSETEISAASRAPAEQAEADGGRQQPLPDAEASVDASTLKFTAPYDPASSYELGVKESPDEGSRPDELSSTTAAGETVERPETQPSGAHGSHDDTNERQHEVYGSEHGIAAETDEDSSQTSEQPRQGGLPQSWEQISQHQADEGWKKEDTRSDTIAEREEKECPSDRTATATSQTTSSPLLDDYSLPFDSSDAVAAVDSPSHTTAVHDQRDRPAEKQDSSSDGAIAYKRIPAHEPMDNVSDISDATISVSVEYRAETAMDQSLLHSVSATTTAAESDCHDDLEDRVGSGVEIDGQPAAVKVEELRTATPVPDGDALGFSARAEAPAPYDRDRSIAEATVIGVVTPEPTAEAEEAKAAVPDLPLGGADLDLADESGKDRGAAPSDAATAGGGGDGMHRVLVHGAGDGSAKDEREASAASVRPAGESSEAPDELIADMAAKGLIGESRAPFSSL